MNNSIFGKQTDFAMINDGGYTEIFNFVGESILESLKKSIWQESDDFTWFHWEKSERERERETRQGNILMQIQCAETCIFK